jgi:hypothetical protein
VATGVVVLALWFLALGVGTSAVLLARRRSRVLTRYEAQQCIHCGYDIRANPAQCPECGSLVLEQSVLYWEERVRESRAL